MSVAIPPRYRFHVRVSVECGVYASHSPLGEIDPNPEYGTGSAEYAPPSTGTVNACV
jgi:hypothetical protein